jgi:hypothetical protein
MSNPGAVPAQRKCHCGWLLPQFEIEIETPEDVTAVTQPKFTVKLTLICPQCQTEIGLAGNN